jgi:hypothetical protein
MDLDAIRKHNLIFVSAQPDQIYFHWQVELYMYQFAKHGIQDQCYAIFGYRDRPSPYAQELAKKYKGIRFYKDTRNFNAPNHYIPSIRPHILKQFFAENPTLGKNVFYHDSDIFLVKLPSFHLLLGDDIAYLSDTVSYIGYKYIAECAGRYRSKYPDLPVDDVFAKMCDIVKIDPDLVKKNEVNSGGAQYLLKNIDGPFWEEVERTTNALYSMLCDYEKKYPIGHHIQKWTADMWGVLWNYWKRGGKSRVHKALEFSWGTSNVTEYHTKPIFHLAGVTDTTRSDKFYKGAYIQKHICHEYAKNPKLFDHVSPDNATYEYVRVIKEYVGTGDAPKLVITDKQATRFLIKTKECWSSVYTLDASSNIMDRPVWRSSDNKYLMFYGNGWVVTAATYESELKEGSGGFAFNSSENPYTNTWNVPCSIEILDP